MEEKVVCRNFRQTTQHGALEGKTQSKDVKYYNLDVIISVRYRVKKTIQRFMFRLLRPSHSSPSATAFDSFSHRSRLIRLMHSSPSATAFDSFSYRIRLLRSLHSSPSAIAFVSSCHCIRLLQLSHSSPSATAFDFFSYLIRLLQPPQPYVSTQ